MTELTLDFHRMWHNKGNYATFKYINRTLTVTILDKGHLGFFQKLKLIKMILFGHNIVKTNNIVGLVFEEGKE